MKNQRTLKITPLVVVSLVLASVGLIASGAAVTIAIYGSFADLNGNLTIAVAEQVTPAVVSVLTETRTSDYYGQSVTSSAAGTGFIVNEDGYVITNKHVVEKAKDLDILMNDGTKYTDVNLIGVDPTNDIAYLKIINAPRLPYVRLGDSKSLFVGQKVVAIGNALGQYQNSVTSGIISGLGRTVTADNGIADETSTLTGMIQTDALINPGNSGGPLINISGEVIGINTATSVSTGIGFAIPISSAKGMLKSALKDDEAKRIYFGAITVNLTPDTAKSFDLSNVAGAFLINSSGRAVIAGSPADKAGLKDKDIILAVNGASVGKGGTIMTLLSEYTVGDTVKLLILRDGKEMTLDLTLEEWPD